MFLHICLAHVMNMNRKQALKIFRRDSRLSSKVHFTMRFLGCLINSSSLSEASELVLHGMTVMTTEYADKHVLDSLHFVETAINNLKATDTEDPLSNNFDSELRVEAGSPESQVVDEGLTNTERETLFEDSVFNSDFVSTKDELEVQNASNSLMHLFWKDKMEFYFACRTPNKKARLEQNRYFMPNYFDWLKKNCRLLFCGVICCLET